MISIRGAREHNLKNIDVDIPKNKLVVMTGLSGSGKSSLAFDTIFAEGQRRYMESMSSYARQFLELQDKPDVDEIIGLSPTIAIDQKTSSHHPRSTVGTVTEIYDHLRILFARAGRPHCPRCQKPVVEQTGDQIGEKLFVLLQETDFFLFAPVIRFQKGEHKHSLLSMQKAGFSSVRFDGVLMDISEALLIHKEKAKQHSIDVLIDEYHRSSVLNRVSFLDGIKKASEYGNGCLTVVRSDTAEEISFSQHIYCPECQIDLPKLEPRLFSFNTPQGACPACTGLGMKLILEPDFVIPNKRLSLAEGAIRPWVRIGGNTSHLYRLLEEVAKRYEISLRDPVEKISQEKQRILFYGKEGETYDIDGQSVIFLGILGQLEEKYRETNSEYVRHELETCMRTLPCPICHGARLRPEALAVRVCGKSIADFTRISIGELTNFFHAFLFGDVKREKEHDCMSGEQMIMEHVSREVLKRLRHLSDIGLGYLTLDRGTVTLSGGEAQRVRLASQIGSELSGVVYVLDEPSIGLHARDNDKLIATLRQLRDGGNSVIVVEHDESMMRTADYLFDIGPGAGEHGGRIVASGTYTELLEHPDSLTGEYLSGRRHIFPSRQTRKGDGRSLTVVGARAFHLKNITVHIPLGTFVCVTGVSGSGKSTLVLDVLGQALSKHFSQTKVFPGEHDTILGLEHLDKVITIDQSPIGRTPRSNPATYTGIFTGIRDIFAEVPEAKMRHFDAGTFSFNVKGGGRCEACTGDGFQEIVMQFMPDIYVECPECHGRRYNAEALEIHYKGKNIADVLNMTVEEASHFFSDQAAIHEKLALLSQVGLEYIKLGQSATTLSGGEAQRVKLATELSRRATGRTLYILDEPTTGLHFEDIKRLLDVLHALVDKGNTVLVIEHQLDVIKSADWVIDMGPEGGEKGGYVVAEGAPKDLIKNKVSETGKYLKALF
ncbi:MAG: UvrABC system protein A [Candidatus Uhrbacteria bacterium GW2011_GWF2_41_16]|uniref:UvrABC system protein A n=2 Tax=Candidatus Uhriibacteriota TaxID=1752732 RepID=A0A0G0VCR8_9BACT|nr:MAG: UvrABC system protein A [Candidatus Uhrbacteria bacterium GW2011_GWC2_41_11]KKR98659.1 MAG: UvrABC system protein A [Candidatus Uhrbacteria bacterium GW2011_GWF2_41_16]